MRGKRNETARVGVLAVLMTGAVMLQGCSSTPVRTDFLGDRTELVACQKGGGLLWWEAPGFNWHDYDKVLLEPVAIMMDTPASGEAVSREELQALSRDFHNAVVEELSPEYAVVTEPGERVLRIRAAITDIDTANPAINVVTTVAAFVPMDMGGASIEVEFADSVTGTRLAAMADRKTGSPVQVTSGFTRLGHCRKAFKGWAKELKVALVHNP